MPVVVTMRRIYNEFWKITGRIAFRKERVVILRDGQPYMALIPIEDLERLKVHDKTTHSSTSQPVAS